MKTDTFILKPKDLKDNRYLYIIDEAIKMRNLDPVKKIITLCLYSGYLKEKKKLSLLLVASAGQGKSDVLTLFDENDRIYKSTQTTRYGIAEDILPLMKTSQPVNHVIVLGFETLLDGQFNMVSYMYHFIASIIEDGVYRIKTFHLDYDFGKNPAKIGILTSCTPQFLNSKNRSFIRSKSFLSRFIVFSYDYSSSSLNDITKDIKAGKNIEYDKIYIIHPPPNTVVECDPKYLDPFNRLAFKLDSEGISTETRAFNHLRILLKASALSNDRRVVTQDDVDSILELSKYMNLELNEL